MLGRIVFFIILLGPVTAQADIISQLETTYQNATGIEAQFEQKTHIDIMDRDETRSGTLYFVQDKFHIAYKKPHKQLYIYNGETLWIYTPRFKEVEIFSKASERIGDEALAFLSGLSTLRTTFRIPKVQKSNGRIELTLIPKKKSSHFKKIILTVEDPSLKLLQAQMWPKQGNQTRYTFSKLELDAKLKEKLFKFNPPKGVAVRRPEF